MYRIMALLSLGLMLSWDVSAQVNFDNFIEYHKIVKKFWTGPQGFLRLEPNIDDPGIDNENPSLFTGEYIFLVKELGLMKGEVKEDIESWAQELHNSIKIRNIHGEVVNGLYNRRPGEFGRHFSRDEQIGLTLIDSATNGKMKICLGLREYGTQNQWRFDNRTFEGRIGRNHDGSPSSVEENLVISLRQPEFIEYIRMCSGRRANGLGQWSMISSLLVTASRERGKTSGKIMAVLRLEAIKDKMSRDLKRARILFYNRLRNQYQSDNFLYEMFKIYFKNPHHPVTTLAQKLRISF